jgi:hypothetical protein
MYDGDCHPAADTRALETPAAHLLSAEAVGSRSLAILQPRHLRLPPEAKPNHPICWYATLAGSTEARLLAVTRFHQPFVWSGRRSSVGSNQ